MFSKIKRKMRDKKIKQQAMLLKNLLGDGQFELIIKDRFGITYDLKPHYNLRHFLNHNSYFDGSIADILSDLEKKKENFKVAIDVGANKGLTTAFLSRFAEKVYAFEPEAANVQKLKRTLELNRSNNVEIIANIVSDSAGQAEFFIAPGDAHHSLGIAHPGQTKEKTVTIPATTLDSFCAERGISTIDVLKVDVEGFESKVFLGAKNLLSQKKIKYIVFEISMGVMERLGFDPSEPLTILENYGYKITTSTHQKVAAGDIAKYGGQDLLATPL